MYDLAKKLHKPSWLQWDDDDLFGRFDDDWHFGPQNFRGREFAWMQNDDGGYQTGPSSSQSPYLVALDERVSFTSILTTGDRVNDADVAGPDTNYRMAGIPDGIGAFDNRDGTFTILMNHEIPLTTQAGAPVPSAIRDHGGNGAFVSKLVVDKNTLQVVSGDDLIDHVFVFDTTAGQYRAGAGTELQLDRLCSGDLPDEGAFFFDAKHGPDLGYDGRIYLSGEESSNAGKGRAFAHVATGNEAGNSYELAWMGNQAWENLLANPSTGKKTVVIGIDDTTPGELFVYVGDKKADGNAVEKAGLTGGKLFGIAVQGVADESRSDGIDAGAGAADGDIDRSKAAFSLVELGERGDVSRWDRAPLESDAEAKGVTDFLRPEDGAWDPTNPNAFYFVTTDAFNAHEAYGTPQTAADGMSRLYKLTFKDAADPAKGGTIEMLLDGTETTNMMDNITVNSRGQVLIQEDPGNEQYSAKIWLYDPNADTRKAGSDKGNSGLTLLAEHDVSRFGDRDADPSTPDRPATPPFNTNEESSGIIDVSDIFGTRGEDVYLLDVQAHYTTGDPQTVEGGQLLAMTLETGNNGLHRHEHGWMM
jgi:hypothetical protein